LNGIPFYKGETFISEMTSERGRWLCVGFYLNIPNYSLIFHGFER